MNNRKPEDVVFETIASCTLVIAALAITALLYQLITVAVPLLESMVFPQVLGPGRIQDAGRGVRPRRRRGRRGADSRSLRSRGRAGLPGHRDGRRPGWGAYVDPAWPGARPRAQRRGSLRGGRARDPSHRFCSGFRTHSSATTWRIARVSFS